MSEKINAINKENADFLRKQMDDKTAKDKAKMNKQEFLLNKPLLKEINDKKRDPTLGGDGRS